MSVGFNTNQFNDVLWNGPIDFTFTDQYKPIGKIYVRGSLTGYKVNITARFRHRAELAAKHIYRISLTTRAGYIMRPTIRNLIGYTWGDDQPVDFTLTNWPSDQALVKAYLTIKKNVKDLDVDALLQLSITSAATASGEITDDGQTSGTAAGFFIIDKNDYTNFKTGVPYQYDIQVINDSGSIYTPFRGVIKFEPEVTISQT